MKQRNILMPVRTVAEWGGVHEWTIDASRALLGAGHKVTFVGAGEVFKSRAIANGNRFIEVDWANWQSKVDEIAALDDFDLIFSHAPTARMLGLEVNKILDVESIVMVHGAYHDFMYQWSNQVDAFLAASPSLVHFTQRFGRVDPWKVVNIPNAAADEVFELPFQSLEMKLDGKVGHIVTASRLSKDKLPQIDAVEESLAALREIWPEVTWQIDIYGDGPLRSYFEFRYKQIVAKAGKSSYKFHGWLPAEEVPTKMNSAFLTVTAGMAGVRALASGSLCVGVGAKSNVGVQKGRNLRAGLWSNFGDHGIFGFEEPSIYKDLKSIDSADAYADTVLTARDVAVRTNSQSVVDSKMIAALHC